MEFKSLTNIESSFRHPVDAGCLYRLLCAHYRLCVVELCRFAEKQREKIYVLDKGKSLMLALSQDLSQNRPAEAGTRPAFSRAVLLALSAEGRDPEPI